MQNRRLVPSQRAKQFLKTLRLLCQRFINGKADTLTVGWLLLIAKPLVVGLALSLRCVLSLLSTCGGDSDFHTDGDNQQLPECICSLSCAWLQPRILCQYASQIHNHRHRNGRLRGTGRYRYHHRCGDHCNRHCGKHSQQAHHLRIQIMPVWVKFSTNVIQNSTHLCLLQSWIKRQHALF